MRTMQPEARKRFLTRGRFGLGDLVIVMYRNVLDPSRVDVDLLAEDGTYHRGAFDVPTRETQPSFASFFQRTKSVGLRFSSFAATRAPSFRFSRLILPSFP